MVIRNVFREKLALGRCTIGVSPGVVSEELVEFCGFLGFDWVFIDGEHSGVDPRTCYALVRASHGTGLGALVKVPSADPSTILGYLETGAFTILVPHINTAEDARAALSAGRYPPLGIRGVGSASRSANFGLTQTPAEYFARANEHVLVIPLIEDIEAVTNIRSILDVPGIEAVMVGPGDLAASMGFPGEITRPEVTAAVDRVISEARSAGKHVGTNVGTPAAANALMAKGVTFIMCSALSLLADAARTFLREANAKR